MSEEADLMRGYMQMAQTLVLVEESEPEVLTEAPASVSLTEAVMAELRDVVSKLRGHTELDENADQAVGVEMGMQRAADMIERVIMEAERGKAA